MRRLDREQASDGDGQCTNTPYLHPSGVDGDLGNFETLVQPGGLYATTSFVAFILTPVCSGVATLLVNIPFFMKGYRFEGFAKDDKDDKDAGAAGGKDKELEVATSRA